MNGHKIINQNALHFLTITVVGWIDVFTRKHYCKILIDSLKHCQKEKELVINAFVLMSNHMHMICYVKEPFQLSDVIRDFKKFTSKTIVSAIETNEKESRKKWMLSLFQHYAKLNKNNKKYQFWQQDNRPIELKSPKWINQKLAYIHLNPVRSGIVINPEDYCYSSAGAYLGNECILDIETLDLNNMVGYVQV
jgi:REP element-mobilizing transposase RayT